MGSSTPLWWKLARGALWAAIGAFVASGVAGQLEDLFGWSDDPRWNAYAIGWALTLAGLVGGVAARIAAARREAPFRFPADWPEGNADADDGATRDYYNRGALLPWAAYHGDWVDCDGTLHGDSHWATTTVDDTDTERFVEWEVADLVRAWLDGTYDNQGFYLRPVSSGRNVIFSSREGGTPRSWW